MSTVNNPSVEAPRSQYDKEQGSTKSRPASTQHSLAESRSTATTTHPARQDSLDVKHHTIERDSKKDTRDTSSEVTTTTPATSSLDHHKAQATSDLSGSKELVDPRDREQTNIPTSNTGSCTTRVQLAPPSTLYAQASKDPHGATEDTSASRGHVTCRPSTRGLKPQHTKDPHHPHGATEGTSASRGRAGHYSSAMRPRTAQAHPGHFAEDEQRDRTSEIKQQSTQVSGYSPGALMNSFMSIIPTGGSSSPPKDKYQLLREELYQTQDDLKQARGEIHNYDRDLRRRLAELRHSNQVNGQLQHEIQRSKDTINGLQNELNNVHQQLGDAKTLSEVRGRELHGAQVFLTKADTLSISEVGEKVTALNEEIFQAAATLGEALIYKRHELSQTELETAAAVSQEMVGEKLMKILIVQSQKPEPEVNPLLVQVVLQILMVKFCFFKIRSWYPSDSAIGGFLAAIYSDIRSTEEQAVSGRWRALTRAHTRPSDETWKKELFQKLHSVSMIASWAPRSPGDEESYGHSLSSIFKAINELRTAIGEKFTSADLDVFVFEGDWIYDPAIMDDAYSDGRKPSGKQTPEPIVGTTGIGLGRYIAKSAKDELESVIFAKVVLKSTLNEALEPKQPRPAKKLKKKMPVENTDGSDPTEGRGSSKSKAASDAKMDVT